MFWKLLAVKAPRPQTNLDCPRPLGPPCYSPRTITYHFRGISIPAFISSRSQSRGEKTTTFTKNRKSSQHAVLDLTIQDLLMRIQVVKVDKTVKIFTLHWWELTYKWYNCSFPNVITRIECYHCGEGEL